MSRERFANDIDEFIKRLTDASDQSYKKKLTPVRNRLLKLKERNLVRINHSILEILCAWHLIKLNYDVDVEKRIGDSILIADIIARNEVESNSLLVEVETGFVPPSAAMNPRHYRMVRIASKLARYSGHYPNFALATPVYHLLQVPYTLLKEPGLRRKGELFQLKRLCDQYYQDPPITYEDLKKAELDRIFLMNVDDLEVTSLSSDLYLELLLDLGV
ncbi:MAG: hypothetical protein GF411_15825 [Candidatus Lokiarchaeota archaeon]|nr:hypothetical protein [Candidatus Lokiarchaeota archaeon]